MTDRSVDDLLKRRDSLKKNLAEWQEKAAVAKSNQIRIKKELAEKLQVLKEEFECESYAEAEKKLQKMLDEVNRQCEDLETRLNALGS